MIDVQAIATRLKIDEGTGPLKNGRLMPYFDCCGKFFRQCTCAKQGKLTLGYGRNIEDRGITRAEADYLLHSDIGDTVREVKNAFPWWQTTDAVRKEVLVEMCFNLGLTKLKGFKNMLHAMATRDYADAAESMLRSLWASQVKGRAVRLAATMRDGLPR